VKTMLLSVGKLLSLGWKASLSGEEAVRLSCRELLGSMKQMVEEACVLAEWVYSKIMFRKSTFPRCLWSFE